MQNRADQSEGMLSGQFDAADHNWELGRRIYSRYGSSPGIISTVPASSRARQIFQFSDRLPLLHILRQRWNLEGIPMPMPPSPLWFRESAQPTSTGAPARAARRVADPPPANSLPVAQGHQISAPSFDTPHASASFLPGSSPERTREQGEASPGGRMPGRDAGIPISAAEPVLDAVTTDRNRSIPTSSGERQLRVETSSPAPAERRRTSSASAGNTNLRPEAGTSLNLESEVTTTAASASSRTPQKLSPATSINGNSLTLAANTGIPSSPGGTQIGPPIFLRQSRTALPQTTRHHTSLPESRRVGDSYGPEVPSKTPPPESLPARRSLSRSTAVLARKQAGAETVAQYPSPSDSVQVTKTKTSPEVSGAHVSVRQEALSTTGLPHPAGTLTTRSVANDSSSPTPATSGQSDTTGGATTAISGIQSCQDPIGQPFAPPMIQRKVTALPPAAVHGSSPKDLNESVSPRKESASSSIDSSIGESMASGASPDRLLLSVAPSAAPKEDAVTNDSGSISSPGAAPGLSLLQTGVGISMEQQEKPLPLPFVQRKVAPLPPGTPESSISPSTAEPPLPRVYSQAPADVASDTVARGSSVHATLVQARRKPSIGMLGEAPAVLVPGNPATSRNEAFRPGDSEQTVSYNVNSPSAGMVNAETSLVYAPLLSAAPDRGAASVDPPGVGVLASAAESSLVQRRPDTENMHPARSVATENGTQERPVVYASGLLQVSPEAHPELAGKKRTQPEGEGAAGAPFLSLGHTSAARQGDRPEADRPGTTPVLHAQDMAQPNLFSLQSSGQALSRYAGSETVLRRTVARTSSATAMGNRADTGGATLALPARSATSHPIWRRTDVSAASPELNHGIKLSPASPNFVQRSAAGSPASAGLPTTPVPPSVPDAGKQTSQTVPSADITQLTNRVYELLVRRLAREKQQRGM